MKTVKYPVRDSWERLLERPENDVRELFATAQTVLDDIRKNGDGAVLKYTKMFDGANLQNFQVSDDEINEAKKQVSIELKEAIQVASDNIKRFHQAQQVQETRIETMPGVLCWQKSKAIERVGLYVPGGSAPLFSTVLMLGLPAKLAGCEEIVLCTPPDSKGKLNPAILYAASLVGVTRVFKVGGIQAIGAMAYGTESVPRVFKIFGPGNRFVTAAKQMVSLKDVAIDMPAGPSEVMVLADASANAAFVAADLLSQAEHGADSQVVFVTNDSGLLMEVEKKVSQQLAHLSRRKIAEKALVNSRLILVQNVEEMVCMANVYAPEHLIISMQNDEEMAEKIVNAGSVFLGNYTPESAGDYASGTNHTLPTHGYARAYSGVNLNSFTKKITYQKITPKGLLSLGPVIEKMAEAELLNAHKNAVSIRMKSLKSK
jgi:histidinol dehydrogenase